MWNYKRLLLVCGTLAVSALAWAQERPRADVRGAGERRPEHVSSWVGDVLIRTDGARVFVMVDTPIERNAAPDGFVDQWFICETAEPLPVPLSEHVGDALLVYSAGVLEVSSSERRFEFALEGESRADDGMSMRVVGVGLAHHRAEKTSVRLAGAVDRARVSTNCLECEVLDPDPGGGGAGGTSCSSGGPGTLSCTATQQGYSCSITCGSGRYACCNYGPSVPYCRCVSG